MRTKPASKVNIFILELTIVILTFALAGAIAVSLFANAHNVAQRATDTNIAMMKTQSLAESFKSQDTFIMDYISFSGINPWPLYYDQDWAAIPTLQSSTAPEQAAFRIAAQITDEKTDAGKIVSVSYIVEKLNSGDEPLYMLQIKKYYSDQKGGG
jgi:hypothetical protein